LPGVDIHSEYTLNILLYTITSQASYSPEYITPTQKNLIVLYTIWWL
jgi:hypothetical protein